MTATPPRPELIALLDAVKDHPDEDTPRLVLADWLDEQGNELDAERAKFIREDIAEAQAHPRRPKRPVVVTTAALLAGAAELLQRGIQWFGPVVALGTVGFRRGLPEMSIHARFFKPDFRALFATEAFAFVQSVRFIGFSGARMSALAAKPEFRFVAGVEVSPPAPFGARRAEQFFRSSHLTGLRLINFCTVNPGVVGARALANNPALSRLRKLSLVQNKLVDKAVIALAGSPHLTNLTHLNLSDNRIGTAGAEALANAPHLAGLVELNLRDNPRLTGAGERVLRKKFGTRLRLS